MIWYILRSDDAVIFHICFHILFFYYQYVLKIINVYKNVLSLDKGNAENCGIDSMILNV